jgi:peroxiredoxin
MTRPKRKKKSMIKKMLSLVILAVVFALPAQAALQIGQPAPEIEVTDIHGQSFKLSDFQGKNIVLEWRNAKCPFVMKHYETGNMQKTQKAATAMDDVIWVSVNSSAKGKQGHITPEEAQALIAKEGAVPTTMILDPSGKIGRSYGAKTTPHMFVVDIAGNLAYMGAIDDRPSPKYETVEGAHNYVLAALNDLADGHSVATSVTQPYGCAVKY